MQKSSCTDADRRLLAALRDCGTDPRVAAAARALSRAGEHGALWLAAGLAAAAADRDRRGSWLRGTVLVAAAHLASMGVKRVVRRPRPQLPAAEPLVRTAGRHSFPSSHASSAAAATVAYGALRPAGARLVPPLAAAMCVSRVVAGVHYPSDIAAGALLGGVTARAGAAWMRKPLERGRR
ncbi:phosphatase PAP2 family protein [Streptomyces violascens]|uniref:phosphatase PAP2 family protein n=1 Tax=Streptomyces violascens TaxID=67381 RepID=UPI0037B8CFBB